MGTLKRLKASFYRYQEIPLFSLIYLISLNFWVSYLNPTYGETIALVRGLVWLPVQTLI